MVRRIRIIRYGSTVCQAQMKVENIDMDHPAKDNERKALAHIAKVVREARRCKGYSQRELADHVGTAQTSIRRMEGGESNVSAIILARTAKALELSLDELMASVETERQLIDRKYEENIATISKGTSAMGLREDEIDFTTQRAILQMLKLWPR